MRQIVDYSDGDFYNNNIELQRWCIGMAYTHTAHTVWKRNVNIISYYCYY